MSRLFAFLQAVADRRKELKRRMVFDWIKAAKIIGDENPCEARAGLSSDWERTSGVIFRDGELVENCFTYLSSELAKPQIEINGHFCDCYRMEYKTKWDERTKWPDEAKAVLMRR